MTAARGWLALLGRAQEAAQQYQAAIELTAKPGVPGVGSSRPGDTNFGGNAQGVTAESFIEIVKAALERGDCQGAAQTMSRATEARFPPDKREEANRCFQGRR